MAETLQKPIELQRWESGDEITATRLNQPLDSIDSLRMAVRPASAIFPKRFNQPQQEVDARWTQVAPGSFTAAPASTSTITIANTVAFSVGLPLKYKYNNVFYYGIVAALTGNATTAGVLSLQGAPLNTPSPANIQELYVGTPEMVVQVDLFVSGVYDVSDSEGLLVSIMNTYFQWMFSKAYLVFFSAVNKTADSGTKPLIRIKIGSLYATPYITMSSTSIVDNAAVAISSIGYSVTRRTQIDIACYHGGTGNAANLTVSLCFVLE